MGKKSWRHSDSKFSLSFRGSPCPWLILLLVLVFSAPAADKPRPAKIQFSGYGILGNRLLKKLVRTVQEEDMKRESVDANFIENAALVILSKMRDDGLLQPTIIADMELADGRRFAMRWRTTIDPPLPRPLSATKVHFKVFEG